jgi:hypothetical protein
VVGRDEIPGSAVNGPYGPDTAEMNDLQGICYLGQVIEALIGDSSCQILTWQTGQHAPDRFFGIHDVARDCREKERRSIAR